MRKFFQLSIVVFFIFLVISCNQAREKSSPGSAVADSTTTAAISSSAAIENGKDSARQFIRTADLKFKVKDVLQSTYDIEDITGRQGGFVILTNLVSNIDYVTTTAISEDSSLESTHSTLSNTMTIRVPNIKLDTTLKEIARNIGWLDYRVIKADDVSLQLLTNDLTQVRSTKTEHRLTKAKDSKTAKLQETVGGEEILASSEEQSDNAKVANLSLKDQVRFSTVNLSIYQRQTNTREMIFNEKNLKEYEPGFGSKLVEALKNGGEIFETFILFIARLWALILVAVLAYIMLKKYGRRMKKSAAIMVGQ